MTNRRRFWVRWGGILLCWVVIGLLIAGRNIVSSVSRGARIAWDEGVLFELIYYLIWGLFTPVIFWFARRHLRGEYLIILRDGTELTSSRRYRKNLDAILGN
jgi:hypothetical protein